MLDNNSTSFLCFSMRVQCRHHFPIQEEIGPYRDWSIDQKHLNSMPNHCPHTIHTLNMRDAIKQKVFGFCQSIASIFCGVKIAMHLFNKREWRGVNQLFMRPFIVFYTKIQNANLQKYPQSTKVSTIYKSIQNLQKYPEFTKYPTFTKIPNIYKSIQNLQKVSKEGENVFSLYWHKITVTFWVLLVSFFGGPSLRWTNTKIQAIHTMILTADTTLPFGEWLMPLQIKTPIVE